MNSIPDHQITHAIQQLGLLIVQRVQQELIEGLRNGEPRGYSGLRRLLEELQKTEKPSADT